MQETVGDIEKSEDSLNVDQTSVIRELEARNKELESRLGELARTSGQEKAKLESEYRAWGESLTAYYTEENDKLRSVIANLENQLVEELPDDGAKRVLQQRNEREREDEERRAARVREQQSYASQLETAKRTALATFGLEADDLAGVTDINQVWAVAGKVSRDKMKEELKKEFTPAPDPEAARELEVEQEVRNARTPSNGTPPARERREERSGASGIQAQIDELQKQYEHHRSRRKMADAMAVKVQIIALERQLT